MGDDGGPDDRRVVRVVNLVAEALGLTAEHAGVRYGVYFASLGCLAVAAFFFGPEQIVGASVALALAFFAVVFVVVFWFFEERRKRRVTLGRELPLKRDALNPDFRDEAIAACLTLFLFVPLTLQTFNKEALHYDVVPERIWLPPVACGPSAAAPCTEVDRLVQLPAWVLFTLRSFVLTTPVGDYASQAATPDDTGVSATKHTPQGAVDIGLKLLFVGFVGSLVGGIYQRVGGQMKDAISNLGLTHVHVAALGPIMLKPLLDVLERQGDGDERVVLNALRALTSIADRYPLSRPVMVEMFEETLRNEVAITTVLHKELDKQILLEAAADALCSMRSGVGIALVRDRAARVSEPFAVKKRFVRVLARTLGAEALPHLRHLAGQSPIPGMKREINRLIRDLQPTDGDGGDGDGDGDGDGGAAPTALPAPDQKVDRVVGGPPSAYAKASADRPRTMTLNFVAAPPT